MTAARALLLLCAALAVALALVIAAAGRAQAREWQAPDPPPVYVPMLLKGQAMAWAPPLTGWGPHTRGDATGWEEAR